MADIYPLNDEFMIFNNDSKRYVLTEKTLEKFVNPEKLKNPMANEQLLERISLLTYKKIHEYNINNDFQDFVIAKTQKGREIIKEAMTLQLTYVLAVGDLSISTDLEKRKLWFDETATEVLMRPIPEIGTHILYTVPWCGCAKW